ncbi:MAG: TonB-dependent receptor [Sphingobium sp.]|uniref:TonB-dependent receptor n=1 Tax=Sphingobium sp. TaxID=1912891 RepID=UPI0029BEA0A5|nr:TonB-dependent receptor [Sphingobium sp.]MDX3911535.1 TonB-dependent receptor [Sphingobium sp.]
MRFSSLFSTSALAGTALMVFVAQPASAQTVPADPTAPQASQGGLEDIVVTAQKRAENVQDTPIAISAFSGDTLARNRVQGIADLSRIAPGIVSGAQYGTNRLFIRGIGLTSIAIGADPSSAFHVDGVYVGRPSAQLNSFFDIDRVEVLRGPQGTLYGRNATGGSVNVITKRPTADLNGYVNVGYGNYDRIDLEGAVGGPLTEDGRIMGRIAVQTVNRDGYGKNLYKVVPGGDAKQDIDDENRQSIRASLLFKPTDGLDITLIGEHSRERDHNYANHNMGPYPGFVLTGPLMGYTAIIRSRDIASSTSEQNRRTGYALTGIVGYDLSDTIRLQSITGWRKWNRYNAPDTEGSTAPIGVEGYKETSRQFSQEGQINYDTTNLKGIVGLFYYKERVGNRTFVDFSQQNFGTVAAPVLFPGAYYEQNGHSDISAIAAFTQWTYSITPQLNITGGLRYSHERRTNEGLFAGPLAPIILLDQAKAWNSFTPKVAIDYHIFDDVMLYASYTKGFKSGTYNTATPNPVVNPEKVTSYEAGVKATLFDRHLELSIGGFYYDYKDLQVNKIIGITAVTVNAATAKNKGIEASARWRVTDGLTLNADLTYLDAKFSKFNSANPLYASGCEINDAAHCVNGEQVLKGNPLPGSNKWGANIGAEYVLPVGGNSLTARLDGNYRSRIYFSEFKQEAISQKGVVKLDGSLRYDFGDRWSATLWGKNLTNRKVVGNEILILALWGFPIAGAYDPPRTYGISLGAKF